MKKFYYDYSAHSRNSIIQKLADAEQNISRNDIKQELKALYYRRYANLLNTLNRKFKELNY